MLLYVIRHGDPDYANDSLTERGFEQAEALGKRLEYSKINRVFSSPNGRARKTAEPTCRRLGLDMTIENWMSEDLNTGLSHKEASGWCFWIDDALAKSDETLAYGDRWYDAPAYADSVDPETRFREIMAASDDFTERLGYRREGRVYRVIRKNEEKVAAFCHMGTGLTWIAYMLGISPALFWSSFDISTSGVTILDFGRGEEGTISAPACLCHSDLSHMYEAGMSMEYGNGSTV